MTLTALVRHGFGASGDGIGSLDSARHYQLGQDFGPVWAELAASGAEYVLLTDNAVGVDEGVLRVLQRILAANPAVAGMTVGAAALQSIYGEARQDTRVGQLPWAARPIRALPSWLALLRVGMWAPETRFRTPEFFLLDGADRLRAMQTLSPQAHFDPVAWAGGLLGGSIDLLAADYANRGERTHVPPQFRITAPGRTPAPPGGDTAAPLFSVIVPSIRPDFLGDAVRSVMDQTYGNWELRIGIDGPKPAQLARIADLLEPYIADPRVHVRYHENIGTGPMRRWLSEQAKGSHLIALDDDDRLPPHALERFAGAIVEAPGTAILRGGTRVFGLIETYLVPRIRYRVDGIPNDLFEVTQPYVVRRDVLQALGGFEWDPGLKNAGEDSDLLLKIDREGLPIRLLDEPLYERRLSTLNQTLDCTAEECARHVRYLYERHDPAGWSLADVRFTGPGPILTMWSHHQSTEEGASVVCSTRFMDFQQVGSREGVIVDLEITSLCNAECSFCPREHLERTQQFIALETVRALAAQLAGEAGPTVVLCGIGESTMHPQLVEIVRILAAAKVNVCMTSNGSRLTLALLDELVAAGLSELNVSLNAVSAETHMAVMQLRNFDGIADLCREIAALRPRRWPRLKFHLSFVVTSRNQHEAEPFVAQWEDTNITQLWLHPLTNRAGLIATKCQPGDLGDLPRRLAGNPKVIIDLFPNKDGPGNMCRVASGVDFVSVEGDMLLCAQDYRARHRFGNLKDASLPELHRNKLIQHLRGATAAVCSNCSFCPRSFVGGTDASYTIVQAGAA